MSAGSRIFYFVIFIIFVFNCWLAQRTLEGNLPRQDTTTQESLLLSNENIECLGWKQTSRCTPFGHREPSFDLGCNAKLPDGSSGYCLYRDKSELPPSNEHKAMMKWCTYHRNTNKRWTCADVRTLQLVHGIMYKSLPTKLGPTANTTKIMNGALSWQPKKIQSSVPTVASKFCVLMAVNCPLSCGQSLEKSHQKILSFRN